MDLDELEKQLETEILNDQNDNNTNNKKRIKAVENLKKAREKLQQKRKLQKLAKDDIKIVNHPDENNKELKPIENILRTQTDTTKTQSIIQNDTNNTQYDTIYNELNQLKKDFYGYLEEKKQKKQIKDTVKNQINSIQEPLIKTFSNVLNKFPLNDTQNKVEDKWITLNEIKKDLIN